METTQLRSRLIESASYDNAANSLFIHMVDGNTRIIKVPRSTYENLISADSPGWYYTRHIRPFFRN